LISRRHLKLHFVSNRFNQVLRDLRIVSEERSPAVMRIEAHEEFIQHIENGQRRIKVLSIITVIVAAILVASYFSQIVLPFAGGSRYQTVDLLNPGLIASEILVLVLSAAWLYVGVVNYLFAARLGGKIRDIRAAETSASRY
jgi:hypothetical protein